MKLTKTQLGQIIKEELEKVISEGESGYLSNIYKWCPAGKEKTSWWKRK
jgi:hypothetical protein